MSSAWLLPEHIADVLPAQARQIEELRRRALDAARGYGYELVIPPLIEHLQALLSGAGEALDLRTFKLVDQGSGKALGIRADTTPQVARIDAHLLNRRGPARLCYCGPVLHARPAGAQASREPLQFGAELYGHQGPEADTEVLDLCLDVMRACGVTDMVVDLGDVRVAQALLHGTDGAGERALHRALTDKDVGELADFGAGLAAPVQRALVELTTLHGGPEVLERAADVLGAWPAVQAPLAQLGSLARRLTVAHPDIRVGVDLSDLGDYGYYTALRFGVYAPGAAGALARGGRYDEVGAAFGRRRPAVGFSLDLKSLAEAVAAPLPHAAVRAPWRDDAALDQVVRALRAQGRTVVRMLPGHEHEVDEFACAEELRPGPAGWQVLPLA